MQNFGVAAERPARFDFTQLAPALEDVYERLSGLTIENLDWSVFLDRYDTPEAMFYLDPPYWDCENDYGSDMLDRVQFELMAAKLRALPGRAMLSLNDVPGVRQTFAGFRTETAELTYGIGQASRGTKAVTEVLIYTFDSPTLPLFG